MQESNRVLDVRRERIGNLDHFGGIDRLDEMFGVIIAVAEMEAEFDIDRHGVGKTL
jgi:hypothetical protein